MALHPSAAVAAHLDDATPLTDTVVRVRITDGVMVRGQDGAFDEVRERPLDPAAAADPSRYRLVCGDAPVTVGQVRRKARPSDMGKVGEWAFTPVLTHELFLHLDRALQDDEACTLSAPDLVEVGPTEATFVQGRSLTGLLRVNQLGYLPEGPKHAALMYWMGDGGPLDVAPIAERGFEVIDEADGRVAASGPVLLRHRADQMDEDGYGSNYESADVWSADFDDLTAPGTYRVRIPGVGVSHPFVIGDDAYRDAFVTAMRGLYLERCGVALGPPHTDYARPLCHHPDMGKVAERSEATLFGTSMGGQEGEDSFSALVRLRTGEHAPLWGGYHDAGDWDRRAQHMAISDDLTLLYELYPERFVDGQLGIPESGDGLPDVLGESLWNMRFWARLQEDDGGVHGGLESEAHPRWGENSWTDSLDLFLYAVDPWTTLQFVASAAATGRALRIAGAEDEAEAFVERGRRAFDWAEAQGPSDDLRDLRNRAAAELFRATGEDRYHQIFQDTSVWTERPDAPVWEYQSHDQEAAAWAYVRSAGADPDLSATIERAIVAWADDRVQIASQRAFRFGTHRWRPMSWGLATVPEAAPLIKAHALTGERKYRDVVIDSVGWTCGLNPNGVCFMSGLGSVSPRNMLHIDSWVDVPQDTRPGLVAGGPNRTVTPGGMRGFGLAAFHPPADQWPIAERWQDVAYDPGGNEVVAAYSARVALAYGFLLADGPPGPNPGPNPEPEPEPEPEQDPEPGPEQDPEPEPGPDEGSSATPPRHRARADEGTTRTRAGAHAASPRGRSQDGPAQGARAIVWDRASPTGLVHAATLQPRCGLEPTRRVKT